MNKYFLKKRKMTKKEKIQIMKETLFLLYPNALTELEYNTEFQLLVAIIMSAQSTDKQVNKVNKNFFQFLREPKDVYSLGEEKIRDFIKSISFFNNKAKYIFETGKILTEKYDSKIPNKIELLQEFP